MCAYLIYQIHTKYVDIEIPQSNVTQDLDCLTDPEDQHWNSIMLDDGDLQDLNAQFLKGLMLIGPGLLFYGSDEVLGQLLEWSSASVVPLAVL